MTTQTPQQCFACDKRLGQIPHVADTRDDQFVLVGSECYKRIKAAGESGYQPPKGGPRLYLIQRGLSQDKLAEINRRARGV